MSEDNCICHRCIEEKEITAEFSGLDYLVPLNAVRMILCPKCGNKRCPQASDHRLECTNSNEPGQEGSIYK